MPTSTSPRKPTVSNTPSVTETDPLPDAMPDVVGHLDDVTRHRGAAYAVPLAAVRPCRADVSLAYHNTMAGRDALLAARPDLEATGLHVDWERLGALDSLARAVVYAADRVEANPRETHEVITLLQEARPLRRLLLASGRAHALTGRCPTNEVERIAKGRGAVDTAIDLVDLALLHTEHDLLGNGSAVSAAQVQRAKVLGSTLRGKIRPRGLERPSRRTNGQRDAMALRDRLWTVLVESYALVERAGGTLWGRQMSLHIPALQGRYVPRKREKKDTAPVAPTG